MASKKKPNIIFVTFDAGRPDHLGYMGYKKNTSPFLDSLAKKGTYFTRAFATGPGSPHSFVAIFTSTFPFDYGGFEYIDRPRVLLSEVLKKNGYTTMGIHSAAYMSAYFGYDRGWDSFKYLSHYKGGGIMKGIQRDTWQAKFVKTFEDFRKWVINHIPKAIRLVTIAEKVVWGPKKIYQDLTNYRPPFYTAEEMNEEVKKMLPAAPAKPFFLWVHYMDTHATYALFLRKSKKFLKRAKFWIGDWLLYFTGEFYWINWFFTWLYLDLYDESVKHVDENIEKLFEYLRSINVLDDDAIVAICSDHGEEFFERGYVGHSGTLYNVNLNVPLILYAPDHVKPEAISRPVSMIDFGPTVLELAGLPKEKSFKGKSFFDETPRPIIGQIPDTNPDLSGQTFLGAAVIWDGYKIIHMIDKKMLFSMQDDFEEKNNLYDTRKDVAEKMAEILKPYEYIHPAE